MENIRALSVHSVSPSAPLPLTRLSALWAYPVSATPAYLLAAGCLPSAPPRLFLDQRSPHRFLPPVPLALSLLRSTAIMVQPLSNRIASPPLPSPRLFHGLLLPKLPLGQIVSKLVKVVFGSPLLTCRRALPPVCVPPLSSPSLGATHIGVVANIRTLLIFAHRLAANRRYVSRFLIQKHAPRPAVNSTCPSGYRPLMVMALAAFAVVRVVNLSHTVD